MEEQKMLTEALTVVKTNQIQMKRCLDLDQLMDGFKSASNMLSELKTSTLGPKSYYELYMAVFDSLRFLSTYLFDAHMSGKHHLADLYELVQYASSILPRLYLMITVASVYMSTPDAPTKEIMKDIMEMSRGVQHPIRGLFLRHYLSGQTRDHLPITLEDNGQGTIHDSIAFILTNFIEMNKLWVRLQHQGHSRDKDKRELERKELRILVGTNLVRLSQLEEIDLITYQSIILPNILEQVVNCRDVIAQEYLMEVVIQVFPDEFQLHTLGPFLAAAAQLNTRVNIKQIVISLIDRLAMYARRESENENPEEVAKQEEEAAKRLADKVKAKRTSTQLNQSPIDKGKGKESEEVENDEDNKPTTVKKFRGIPEDVKLFEVFWQQIVQLIDARPDLSIQDITALLVSLIGLSLNCYPDRLEYVDQVLLFTKEKLETIPLSSPQTINNVLNLLTAPINYYHSVITLLALPSYLPLLKVQPYQSRKSISLSILNSLLVNSITIDSSEDVEGIIELCQVLIKDQVDGPKRESYDEKELAHEQGLLARIIHFFKSDDVNTQFQILRVTRKQLEDGKQRIKYTFPTLITTSIKLSRQLKDKELFKFIHQSIFQLHVLTDSSYQCLQLFLLGAKLADEVKFDDIAYEFITESLLIFEQEIVDSKKKLIALNDISQYLKTFNVFSQDDYFNIADNVKNYSSKLLKKSHQAQGIIIASQNYYQPNGFKNGNKVLDCLQHAIKIATNFIDPITTVEVYVDVLDSYLEYFEKAVEEISTTEISNLVALINNNIDIMFDENQHPISISLTSSSILNVKLNAQMVLDHFKNLLSKVQQMRQHDQKWNEIDIAGPSLKYLPNPN